MTGFCAIRETGKCKISHASARFVAHRNRLTMDELSATVAAAVSAAKAGVAKWCSGGCVSRKWG
jgi:hypothetical protein